jgi:hypothetical protein
MSLKKQFKSNAAKIQEGVWFALTTNSDGTKCRVRLRRQGRSNRLWTAAFRERTKNMDMEKISVEEDEIITADVFVDSCVVDWENLQPEDDGVSLPFSEDNARVLLKDPDWNDLLKDWQAKAAGLSPFQDEAKKKAEAGN